MHRRTNIEHQNQTLLLRRTHTHIELKVKSIRTNFTNEMKYSNPKLVPICIKRIQTQVKTGRITCTKLSGKRNIDGNQTEAEEGEIFHELISDENLEKITKFKM